MKQSDLIQETYLDLLAAWGDSPIDEEEVKKILTQIKTEAYEKGYQDARDRYRQREALRKIKL